jgi:sulfur carrier protein ThiS
MTLEEFILSLGYTKETIAVMSDDQIRWLQEQWIRKLEGK